MHPGKIAKQILFLTAAGFIAGLGSSFLHSPAIPLVQDWSPQARLSAENGEDGILLDTTQAILRFNKGDATFIDARSAKQFEKGHIPGALNLPWHAVQEQFMAVAPHMTPDRLIITYCDGGTCSLSHDLALFLREMGFNVKVMTGGWQAWTDAEMPVESQTGDDHNA